MTPSPDPQPTVPFAPVAIAAGATLQHYRTCPVGSAMLMVRLCAAAYISLLLFAATGCSKPQSPRQSEPDLPKTYGVYLQRNGAFDRLALEPGLDAAKPIFQGTAPIRILVFAREIGASASSLEDQISLMRGVYLSRSIEQISARAGGLDANGEPGPIVSYSSPRAMDAFDETATRIKLDFQPVPSNRDAVFAIPAKPLPPDIYILAVHGRKIPVVIGATTKAEIPASQKWDLWLTTLHQGAGALQQLQGSIGSAGTLNGRRILTRVAKPASVFSELVTQEQKRFKNALNRSDLAELLQALERYRPIAGLDEPAVVKEAEDKLGAGVADAKERKEWNKVALLADLALQHDLGNAAFREAKRLAENAIRNAEAEAKATLEAGLPGLEVLGRELVRFEDVKPLGNTETTNFIVYEGGISWVKSPIFSDKRVVTTLFRDLAAVHIDDRDDPFSSKKAAAASFGYNTWINFRDQAQRDAAVRFTLETRELWEKAHESILTTAVTASDGVLSQKVWVRDCRFSIYNESVDVAEMLIDDAQVATRLEPKEWFQTSRQGIEFLRFRAARAAKIMVHRFPIEVPPKLASSEKKDPNRQSIAIGRDGVSVNGKLIASAEADGGLLISLKELTAVAGAPNKTVETRDGWDLMEWEGFSLVPLPDANRFYVQVRSDGAANPAYPGDVSLDGVPVTGSAIAEINAELGDAKLKQVSENQFGSSWQRKHRSFEIMLSCDAAGKVNAIYVSRTVPPSGLENAATEFLRLVQAGKYSEAHAKVAKRYSEGSAKATLKRFTEWANTDAAMKSIATFRILEASFHRGSGLVMTEVTGPKDAKYKVHFVFTRAEEDNTWEMDSAQSVTQFP